MFVLKDNGLVNRLKAKIPAHGAYKMVLSQQERGELVRNLVHRFHISSEPGILALHKSANTVNILEQVSFFDKHGLKERVIVLS